MIEKSLPFKITIATSAEEISEIAKHRSETYSRDLPEMAKKLREPEPADMSAPGRQILVARSKESGEILGSLRIHMNNIDPLPIQRCVDLPEEIKRARLIEAGRLAVSGGLICGQALFKGLVGYANRFGAQHCVIGSLERTTVIYRNIGFEELFGGQTMPISYANNAEHKILWLPLAPDRLSPIMMRVKKSMRDFYFMTDHGSDIDLSGALPVDKPAIGAQAVRALT